MAQVKKYNEEELKARLHRIGGCGLVAFASAAASRALLSLDHFKSDMTALRAVGQIIEQLWGAIEEPKSDSEHWSAHLDFVMALFAEESIDGSYRAVLAEDGLSALAYAIRCLQSQDPAEAVWAARCVYSAADEAAIRKLGIMAGSLMPESQVLTHRFVQRELGRQLFDLDALERGEVGRVRERASRERLLTDTEFAELC